MGGQVRSSSQHQNTNLKIEWPHNRFDNQEIGIKKLRLKKQL